MKLAHLLSKERTLEIDIDGETLTVSYNPADLTPELEDKMQTCFETNRSGKGVAKYLVGLLLSWDLEDDGTPIPLTIEALDTLPIYFLGEVTEKVIEDSNPKKTSVETSLGGSRRKAR